MDRRQGSRGLLFAGVACLALAALLFPAAAVGSRRVGVSLRPAGASAARAAARVKRYWTPARMRAARPLDASAQRGFATASFEPIPDATQPPFRNVGRVFFRVGRFDGFCSGTAINSASRQLVLTAGHCLYDILPHHRKPSKTRTLLFVPAFTIGTAPFGEFVATKAILPSAWLRKLNENYDIAAVLVQPNSAGQNVADAVGGGEPIALNQPRAQAYQLLGYPGGSAQGQMQTCTGNFVGKARFPREHWVGPSSSAVDCFMSPGASGGPWLIAGGAEIAGITTFGIRRDQVHTFGPYFATKNVGRLVSGL